MDFCASYIVNIFSFAGKKRRGQRPIYSILHELGATAKPPICINLGLRSR